MKTNRVVAIAGLLVGFIAAVGLGAIRYRAAESEDEVILVVGLVLVELAVIGYLELASRSTQRKWKVWAAEKSRLFLKWQTRSDMGPGDYRPRLPFKNKNNLKSDPGGSNPTINTTTGQGGKPCTAFQTTNPLPLKTAR